MSQHVLSATAKKRKGKLERKKTLIALSFIAPNFIGFALFTLIPVFVAVFMSMTEWGGGPLTDMKWVGLENYAKLFTVPQRYIDRLEDPNFFAVLGLFFSKVDIGIALKNTVTFTVITVPLTLMCSIALALVLNKAVKGAVRAPSPSAPSSSSPTFPPPWRSAFAGTS